MKKELFLQKVCARLSERGLSPETVKRQRAQLDAYLAQIGVGEESAALDNEDPSAFADNIISLIRAKQKEKSSSKTESGIKPEAVDAPTDFADEEGATREYSISELIEKEEELSSLDSEEAEEEEEDDYFEIDDGRSKGNSVFFWILTVLLSPVWIPIAALIFLLIGISYPILLAFVALYIPILVVLILAGSVTALAELIYSIVKLVGGETHIALFELGLGIFVVALTMCLSVLTYRGGTKYAPRAVKKYWKTVKKLLRRLKRTIIRIKGVCSI